MSIFRLPIQRVKSFLYASPHYTGRFLFAAVLAAGVFGFVAKARAETSVMATLGDFIAEGVAGLIVGLVIPLLGNLLTIFVSILIEISKYNDFINAPAVVNGWVVTRDIANMFFVVILLVIAFATILGKEEYQWRKLLPKLLIMAVVINFSRTIAGLLIDAAQVVMITFVNGYSAAAGGNFANALQITQLLQLDEAQLASGAKISQANVAIAAMLAAMMLVVSIVVVLVMCVTLVYRTVMIWLLVVTAPLTWFGSTFPQGKKYYDKWWQEFQNQVLVGPALAFFLWLSLASIGTGNASETVSPGLGGIPIEEKQAASISKVGSLDTIFSYIISIGLLMGGLQVAQDLGGSFAGTGSSWLKGKAKGAVKGVVGAAKYGLGAADLLQAQVTGVQLAKVPEKFKKGWQERTSKLEQKASERGLTNLQAMRKVPLLTATGIPSLLMDPSGFAKNVLSMQGIVARTRQGLAGTYFDKKWKLNRADARSNEAKRIQVSIKQTEDSSPVTQAKAALDTAVQNRDVANRAQEDAQGRYNDAERSKKEGTAAEQLASLNNIKETRTGYNLARESGLIGEGVSEKDFRGMNEDQENTLRDQARTRASDWNQKRPSVDATQRQASSDMQNMEREVIVRTEAIKKAKKDYETVTPFLDAQRRAATALDEDARSLRAAYLRGGPDYGTRIEQTRNQYEQEAYKKVDLSRSTDELIGDLERGLAQGDRAIVTLLSKELSKRGSSDTLFEKFGIKEGGQAGLKRYASEVLQGRAGVDEDYAMKTALRMATNEADKGNIGFKGAMKADPITREIKWQDVGEMAKSAAASMHGKSVRSVIDNTSPGSLTRKGADGKVELSPQAMGFLSKLNSNTAGLKKIINDGNMKSEMLQALHGQLAVLRRIEGVGEGKLSKELIDVISREGAKVPPAAATDPGKVAQAMYAALYPSAPGGGNP